MLFKYFSKTLLDWHKEHNIRKLPWKGEKDPYKIWMSEIILQQTRTSQGSGYYNDFITSFPDIKSLASAPEELIYKKWEGLGYYTRCKNMIASARVLHERYNGEFPNKYNEILALKGVGPYTAAAIASFAFGLPYPVVDGNVKRVLSRFFGIAIPIDTTEGKKILKEMAEKLLPPKEAAAFNQAIMDFGATVCKPSNPWCTVCPLQKKCYAYLNGKTKVFPVRSKYVVIKNRYFNYLVIHTNGFIYLKKRGGKDIWENLYEPLLIESKDLLSISQVHRYQSLSKYFENGEFKILDITSPKMQKLTHQKITSQFIRIRTNKKFSQILGYKPEPLLKLKMIAFPKIVAEYLKDKNIPLNLNS